MKALIVLTVIMVAVIAGCTEKYGQPLPGDLPRISVMSALTDQAFLNKGVLLEGTILTQCQASGCWFFLKDDTGRILIDLAPSNFTLPINTKIKKIEQVEMATPILLTQAPNLKSGKMDIVYGIDMADVSAAKPEWKIEGKLPEKADEVLLGDLLAQQYKLHPGDTLAYGPPPRTFKVTGVLKRTNSEEDGAVFLPIATVQEMIAKPGLVTSIGVRAKHSLMVETIRDQLAFSVPGIQIVTISQISENLANLFASTWAVTLSIAILVTIISVMGIINSALIITFERAAEIGMLRAIGAARRDIFLWTLSEVAILFLIGTLSGILLSLAGSDLIEALVRQVTPYVPSGQMITFEPALGAMIFILFFLVSLLAGFYPAWKSSRVDPIKVMR